MQFARDIDAGLSQKPKYLPSKYFYDEEGDKLFQQIMQMPEYYPTNCEFEIFSTFKERMLKLFSEGGTSFRLIEFGAGDGFKTKVLLRHFLERNSKFEYLPIDISGNVLQILAASLKQEMPNLNFRTVQGDYFESLKKLHEQPHGRDVVLFLGGNIGNFKNNAATEFLHHIADYLNPGDLLVVGADLKKDPATILNAYNDKGGITKAFNMNLLNRINQELDGNFNVQNFLHYPVYDPQTGECKSYLVSTKPQVVKLQKLDKVYNFGAYEAIFTEVSKKYDKQELVQIAERAGFSLIEHLHDCKHFFTDAVFKL